MSNSKYTSNIRFSQDGITSNSLKFSDLVPPEPPILPNRVYACGHRHRIHDWKCGCQDKLQTWACGDYRLCPRCARRYAKKLLKRLARAGLDSVIYLYVGDGSTLPRESKLRLPLYNGMTLVYNTCALGEPAIIPTLSEMTTIVRCIAVGKRVVGSLGIGPDGEDGLRHSKKKHVISFMAVDTDAPDSVAHEVYQSSFNSTVEKLPITTEISQRSALEVADKISEAWVAGLRQRGYRASLQRTRQRVSQGVLESWLYNALISVKLPVIDDHYAEIANWWAEQLAKAV